MKLTPDNLSVIGLTNALDIDEQGWALIPYGSSVHSGKDGITAGGAAEKMGVIQHFTREDAIALVNDFKSTWSAIKRAIVGLPVFKGHPDAPRFASRYPDKSPRGSIADMEVRENGLAFKPVLTPQGAADVEGGLSQFSPYWLLKKTGEEAGRIVAAPFKLISVGLVAKGNIPGLSLVNASEPDFSHMKPQLLALLAALGKAPAADATDDQIIAAANEAHAFVVSNTVETRTKLATVESDLANQKKANGDLAKEISALANSVETANSALKAERSARAALVVEHAISTGRITPAEKDATVLSLVNAADFTAEEKRLAALRPKLKTAPGAFQLSKQRTPEGDASTTVLSLVNERMEKNGEDYATAFVAVQTDPKHAALFAAMKQPAKK